MKNYIYITLVLIGSFFTSCDGDYLDVIPDNIATLDNAFDNRFNAEKFLYTLYQGLPDVSQEHGNVALSGGDEVWYPSRLQNNQGVRIAQGFQSSSSPSFDTWSGDRISDNYVSIRNCNIFIDRIDGVLGMQEYEKLQWKSEAKVLKAYFHFLLMQKYGPVVISDEAVPVHEAADQLNLLRSTIDEGFTYIVDLLEEAQPNLPIRLQFEDVELGRLTKPIVASIKARVLMTSASPLFNGNAVYSNFVNKKGDNLFPTQYDPAKWEKAVVATKEAIDLCHEAGFKLFQVSDYVNPNSATLQDVTLRKATLRGRITEKWNTELVWGYSDNTSGGIQSASFPRLYSYLTNPVRSNHAPTLRMAELYYSSNGVPIEEDINYDYANRYKTRTSLEADKYFVEEGQETAILHFNRETRFYSDLSFDRGVWFGNGKEVDDNDVWNIHARGGEFASVFEVTNYSVTGYWPKKLVPIKATVRNGNQLNTRPYAFPIIRLADLYLYYTEALNETKAAPDAQVYEFIDKVRERAGLAGVVDSWTNFSSTPGKVLSQEGMRSIIQQERMIEMSFEGARFWDLRRWNLAKKYMNKPIRGWNVLENSLNDYYTIGTIYNVSFSEKDYLWPISENELVNNPELVQNPGW